MGFNLKIFFEELEHLLGSDEVTPELKIEILKAIVDFNKHYAIECGYLK